jgi:hypothetical protein
MSRSSQRRKNLIRWALGVLLAIDLALVLVNWRAAASPQARASQLQRLRAQHDLLAADVRRAAAIRKRLPEVQREYEEFFAKQLRPASSGYSSIVADLGAIAKKAGLRTGAVTFRQRDLANRGVVEVEVVTTVEGDYPSLVSFINGLERSDNFYLLDNLSLASNAGGSLKLNLQLRTYFRS